MLYELNVFQKDSLVQEELTDVTAELYQLLYKQVLQVILHDGFYNFQYQELHEHLHDQVYLHKY